MASDFEGLLAGRGIGVVQSLCLKDGLEKYSLKKMTEKLYLPPGSCSCLRLCWLLL
jgi:hypothetical protein